MIDGEAVDPLRRAAATFGSLRPRLFGIAYRIVGSSAEAEDIVQDAWLRWQTCDRDSVVNSTAFLVTTTTRLALNATQSARRCRETYAGSRLAEFDDTGVDPELHAERDEALALAMFMLLERLSPMEQAAFLLREAFDDPYPTIARVLRVSEVNARQLVSRARKHVRVGRTRVVPSVEHERLLHAFLVAAHQGDFGAIEEIFGGEATTMAA